ncbi:MAG TPA: hypothetical protein VMC09_05890, partial [Anaerolineales bacterium]|nr:hypothetical protein [Anaerolineales bacterium]
IASLEASLTEREAGTSIVLSIIDRLDRPAAFPDGFLVQLAQAGFDQMRRIEAVTSEKATGMKLRGFHLNSMVPGWQSLRP